MVKNDQLHKGPTVIPQHQQTQITKPTISESGAHQKRGEKFLSPLERENRIFPPETVEIRPSEPKHDAETMLKCPPKWCHNFQRNSF